MKISNVLKKLQETKILPKSSITDSDKANTASLIYEFAANISQQAEYEFNLSQEDGDLIYNSLVTVLNYLNGYPEN